MPHPTPHFENPALAWWHTPAKPHDELTRNQAIKRQNSLTKPPGSLGRLEEVAIMLAAMQGREKPRIERPAVTIFAADHGVVAEGVSAFPQAVTQQMLANFVAGGAAISVLAREQGARLEVVDAGTLGAAPMPGVIDARAGAGTDNFAHMPAMREEQLAYCLDQGRQAVHRVLADGCDLFIGGEMGIGNSTAAAAVSCALLGLTGTQMAGPGTGLDAHGVMHKAAVIDRALLLHLSAHGDAPEALRCVGGFEIAALAGAYIACSQSGLPVLVDGFIATTAALAACRMHAGVRDWLLFAHASAEPGHARLLAALQARPLLQLDMRLGEGSGAAIALPLLRLACALHAGMATFAEAGVQTA